MKKFLAISMGVLWGLAVASPLTMAAFVPPSVPDTYVLDQAAVISEQVESQLEAELAEFEQVTSTQIVVVTLESLQGDTIERAGLLIGREWGVGQEEFDNGVVLVIAPNEREVRIEVGRGLEGILPDSKAWLIIDEAIVPRFAEGDFDAGVVDGLFYIKSVVENEEFDLSELENNVPNEDLVAFAFVALWFVLSIMSNTKSWWLGGVFGGVVATVLSGSLLIILAAILVGLAVDFVLSKYFYGLIPMSGGGGRGGRGGSGGFGGFRGGGGSFGGGGASGRW